VYTFVYISIKYKITAIRLGADMSNFLWVTHDGDDWNPDAECFPAGNLD
jgi:hypothetical protein